MQQALLSAADTLGRMIQSARRDLAGGRTIDASRIEQVVLSIHRVVADNVMALPGDDQAALAERLDAAMAELGALEAELVAQHRPAAGA